MESLALVLGSAENPELLDGLPEGVEVNGLEALELLENTLLRTTAPQELQVRKHGTEDLQIKPKMSVGSHSMSPFGLFPWPQATMLPPFLRRLFTHNMVMINGNSSTSDMLIPYVSSFSKMLIPYAPSLYNVYFLNIRLNISNITK